MTQATIEKQAPTYSARLCLICKGENTNNRPFCWTCERERVFTAYQANRSPFEFYGSGAYDAVLYSGPNSGEASDAIEAKARELRQAHQEHYYLFVVDQHMNSVCSISR
jgi:predicted amidophosphoribosyltransferase